ncbi:MAG TPA: CBS domain-containing protein [Usitatibacter sp.]|nr:CBS domain-containing protein [Usitatibacter sp.]
MTIGEICTREVVYVGSNESAGDAARLMREHHVGSLVVLEPPEAGGKPVGVITDRDLAVGIVALSLDAERTPVEAVMRPGVTCIREDEGLGRAVTLMKSVGVRRLPVIDAKGALVGIVTADDLLELVAEEISGLAGMVGREFRRERDERVATTH